MGLNCNATGNQRITELDTSSLYLMYYFFITITISELAFNILLINETLYLATTSQIFIVYENC